MTVLLHYVITVPGIFLINFAVWYRFYQSDTTSDTDLRTAVKDSVTGRHTIHIRLFLYVFFTLKRHGHLFGSPKFTSTVTSQLKVLRDNG